MLVYQPWEKASMAAIFPSCTSTGNRPSTHPCVIAAQHIMGWRPPDLAYARHEHWRHAVKGTAYCVFDLCRSLGSYRVPHVAPSMDSDHRNSDASTLLHLLFSTSSGAKFSRAVATCRHSKSKVSGRTTMAAPMRDFIQLRH